ncbi:hypothetical protein PG991_001584 [Apiospora marii]|uniref:Fungal N-terminal domain-containing protein n=1 Tax=Apiospora marii TaxID=335849 RepID=A0ABR1SQ88_9PEZI
MADLLSGAASVAGLVSLGLTVTGGIERAELSNLEGLVVALAECSTTTSWRSKVKDTQKTLTYAFDRPTVEQLVMKLDHTIQIIQLSLYGLGLDLSRLQGYKLDRIETTSGESASDVKKILPGVKDRLDQIEGRLSASLESVKSEGLKGNQLLQQNVSDGLAGLESKIVGRLLGCFMDTDSSRAVSWLASKPAALRELLDETSKSQNLKALATVDESESKGIPAPKRSWACVCGHRRRVQKRETPPGLFRIYSETWLRSHESYCPLSRAKFVEERSTKFGICFYGLVHLMNVMLNISFHITSGAGGRSISPTFTYYPTVDRKSDPGFRVVDAFPSDLIAHKMHCLDRCSSCMTTVGKMAVKKLKGLFFAGKSSPKAVDTENQSLLHVVMLMTDVPPVSLRDDFAFNDQHRLVALLEKSARLAEGYECGPLTTAILANEVSKVADLIAAYPGSMQEENLLKQTPLHVAVRKPHMLFLLLSTSSFIMMNKRDSAGLSPLDYAIRESESADHHMQSDHGDGACHSSCSCTRSLDLILEAALRFPQILEPHREWGDGAGSDKAYRTYERYMGNCRDRLRRETLQALTEVGVEASKATLTPFPGSFEEDIIESIREPKTNEPSLADRWRVCRGFYLQHQKLIPTEDSIRKSP